MSNIAVVLALAVTKWHRMS